MANPDDLMRAQKADAILKDPVVADAFKAMEDGIQRDWRMATTVDVREQCFARHKNLEDFKRQLQKFIDAARF